MTIVGSLTFLNFDQERFNAMVGVEFPVQSNGANLKVLVPVACFMVVTAIAMLCVRIEGDQINQFDFTHLSPSAYWRNLVPRLGGIISFGACYRLFQLTDFKVLKDLIDKGGM